MFKNIFFRKTKKAISPVVATALLLVVAVISIVGFNSWFNNFSSGVFVDVESESSSSLNSLVIEDVIGNNLYFRSDLSENVSLDSIRIGDEVCDGSWNISNGMNIIDVSSCVDNLTNLANDIVLVVGGKVLSKSVLFEEKVSFNVPVVVEVYNSCKAILDNGSSVGDGFYFIDVDGDGLESSFEVYCDMVSDGGGWTLVGSKINDSVDTWTYDNRSLLWDNVNFGNVSDAFNFDYKSKAWFLLNGSEVMLMNASNSNGWVSFNSMISDEPLSAEMDRFPRTETESLYVVYKNNSVTYDCGTRTYGYSASGSSTTGKKMYGFSNLKLYPEFGFNSCNYGDYEAGDFWICTDVSGADNCFLAGGEERQSSAYFKDELVFVR